MIAKQIKGKDFYGLLAYNEKKVENDQGYVLDSSITHDTVVNMTKEFNIVRQLRPRLGKAVYHVSLNLPPGENLGDREFTALAFDYLKGMGFDSNQYIIYRHTDTQHEHIHIIANRIKYSGEVVSDSKDYRRSEQLVRKLEAKYGLSTLESPELKKKSGITQQEIEKAIRTGKAPIKLVLQQRIDGAMLRSNDITSFIRELKNKKVYPMFNASVTTGRVTGISFDHQGVVYKGSTLGRQYSWNNIIKHLDYDQARDCSIILENSRPSKRHARAVGEIGHGPKRAIGTPKGDVERAKNAHEKPEYHVGKDKTIGWVKPLVDDNPWSAFRLELEEQDRYKRKRKRRRRRS
ncbi:relaxase/mobilization nuclease domain-containing protein [Croceitalea marina]|uniref:Relaxase/mobilization nuclease domain-containing protein n=1 Tax=Croceitalea marina TaxID=1775166 RepID=A0ABW5MUG1_9FLAO